MLEVHVNAEQVVRVDEGIFNPPSNIRTILASAATGLTSSPRRYCRDCSMRRRYDMLSTLLIGFLFYTINRQMSGVAGTDNLRILPVIPEIGLFGAVASQTRCSD